MADRQFDPYQAWLGIPRQETEADHYQLLGLTRFEADRGKIHAAYQQRHSVVRTYEVGAYADHALQMLEELSAAYYCLTSAAGKVEYDEQLRRREAETRAGAGAGTAVAGPLPQAEARIEPPPRAWAVEPPPRVVPAAPPLPVGGLAPAVPAAADGEPQVAPVVVTASIAACAGCGSPIPPQENCLIVPVAIDAEGNLRSALARVARRNSLVRISVGIDAAELGYAPARCGPYLTRASWVAILGVVAAVAVTVSVLLHTFSGEDPRAPTAFLAAAALACTVAAWWFYVPRISTGEEAAWDRLGPHALGYDRPVRDFAFLAGLADASFRHAIRRLGDDVGAVRRWRTGRLRREAARKRAAVLERCLGRGELLLRTGQIGPGPIGQLYRLAVTDALTMGANPARLRALLGRLFDHCLGDALPLACLDAALVGVGLYDRLPPTELWRVRLQLYRTCFVRAFSARDILALTERSRALKRMFFVRPEPTVEAIAFALALLRVRPNGLAADGGVGIWEMNSASDEAAWAAAPDLLAFSRDRRIALRTNGFCFQDALFQTAPAVSVTRLKSDRYILHVGHKAVAYASDPAKEAEWISAWVSLYFSDLLPAKDHELARPAAVEHLQRSGGMSVICPGCERTVSLTEDEIRRHWRSSWR